MHYSSVSFASLVILSILSVQGLIFWGLAYYMGKFKGMGGGPVYRMNPGKKSQKKVKQLDKDGEILNLFSNNSLKIRNVRKKFGTFYALNGVNLDLRPGIITCILGHNGAGKTTLINTILGMQPPTSGNIFYNDTDIYKDPSILAGQVGYCSADPCMYESFTVFDFMMYLALLKGIEEPEEHITNLLLRCKLEKFSDQVIGKLSGGAVKRASLATSLIGDPKIIFLDEPSSGVDVANRKEVWDFLTSLKSKDRVILLTTHQLEEAEHIS